MGLMNTLDWMETKEMRREQHKTKSSYHFVVSGMLQNILHALFYLILTLALKSR